MMKFKFSALLLIALFIFVPCSVWAENEKKIGDDYINFMLEDLDGNQVELSSYAGQVIFLDLWASWCLPCARELPFLVKTYEKYKGQGFVVIAVSVDEKKKNIEKFFRKKMKRKKPGFPILRDPEQIVRKLYNMTGIPASVIIGKDGKIAFQPRIGFEESYAEEITKQIEDALAAKEIVAQARKN